MNNDITKDVSHAIMTAEDESTKVSADVYSERKSLDGQENLRKKKAGTIKKALDDNNCCWPPELH